MAAVTTVTGVGVRAFPMTRPTPPRVATPRTSRTSPATFRRRRIAIAVLALGVVVVTGQAGAALGGSTLAAPERRPSPSSVHTVVVRPGDTLWGIAHRLAPNDDPRPLVDQLAAVYGHRPLVPGETLQLPS
jgi:nucleoid-associated protein YgaU